MTVMIAHPEMSVPLPEDQERRLLARCRAGDVDALGLIYERYERRVFRYAYHMLGHSEDAHDVRQETFLRAFQSIDSFRGEGDLLAWLLKICANLCRGHLRARQRADRATRAWAHDPSLAYGLLASCPDDGGDPAAAAQRAQTIEIAGRALDGLPSAQRELLILREVEGLSYQQIAGVLGCAQASVKVLLFRARRNFTRRAHALLEEG